MCGIVYSQNFDGTPVNKRIYERYAAQRSRGVEGFGVFDGEHLKMSHATQEFQMLKWLVKYPSSLMLFHHRFPTSTENVKSAAHPFSTKDYFGKTQYILAHNGVMKNHNELFEEHEKMGITYKSYSPMTGKFNDSEALLWDFALTQEGKQDKMKAMGNIAFICLKKVDGKLTEMFFNRNSRPLMMDATDTSITLASEGGGTMVKSDTLYTFDYATHDLSETPLRLLEYEPYTGTLQSSLPYHNDWGSSFRGDELEPEEEEGEAAFGSNWGHPGNKGDWVPTPVRERFRKLLTGKKTPIEYELDEKSHMYVPVNSTAAGQLPENVLAAPSGEAQELALEYLTRFEGHFEQAYWALECDYDEIETAPNTLANLREKLLLEKTLDIISHDPDYINEKSVSALWGNVCHQ